MEAARILAPICAASILAALLVGCSLDWSKEHVQPGAGGGGGTTTSTGSMGSATSSTGIGGGTGGGQSSVCGTTPPPAGSPCDDTVEACWYGDDVRPKCRLKMECGIDEWEVEEDCTCPPADDSICPPSAAGPAPSCPLLGTVVCAFPDGSHCGCYFGLWHCPPAPPGCPFPTPNVGQPCSQEQQLCFYGDCLLSTALMLRCEDGHWAEDPPPCDNEGVQCL